MSTDRACHVTYWYKLIDNNGVRAAEKRAFELSCTFLAFLEVERVFDQ